MRVGSCSWSTCNTSQTPFSCSAVLMWTPASPTRGSFTFSRGGAHNRISYVQCRTLRVASGGVALGGPRHVTSHASQFTRAPEYLQTA
eukprot:3464890-Prymnesium_polylepis.1